MFVGGFVVLMLLVVLLPFLCDGGFARACF